MFIVYRLRSLLYSALFLVCRIFPIEENKIVCCNLSGRGCGDNPRYILEEINRQGLDYQMYWLLNEAPEMPLPEGVRWVPNTTFSSAYHLSTAKIWIDTHNKKIGVLKRRGQYYIQTWHGNYGMKKIAIDETLNWRLASRKTYSYNTKLADVMISNSKMTTSIYRSAFRYEGQISEYGSPRNDLFFGDTSPYREKVASLFSIKEKQIALYAPTYRDSHRTDWFQLDFEKTRKALKNRFGGDWIILIRLHPNITFGIENLLTDPEYIQDVTNYPYMQELLAAADVLISDYSSCVFDYAETGRPCFLYAPDLEEYDMERGFYWDITSLPFPLAQSNDELAENIQAFDESAYAEKLSDLFAEVGLCDNGSACRQVVELIKEISPVAGKALSK